MALCICGCGKETAKGKQFLQGHYSKWKKQMREQKDKNIKEKEIIMNQKPEQIIEEQPEPPEEPIQYQPIPPPNKIRLGVGKIQVSMESIELNMSDMLGAALFAVKDLHTLGIKMQTLKPEPEKEKTTNIEVNKLHEMLKKEARPEQPGQEPTQPLPAGC